MIGRNGMHSSIDANHSMLTAMVAVENNPDDESGKETGGCYYRKGASLFSRSGKKKLKYQMVNISDGSRLG